MQGTRPLRVACSHGELIVTSGFDSGTNRSVALWDVRALGKVRAPSLHM
jgi:hypothetical protein